MVHEKPTTTPTSHRLKFSKKNKSSPLKALQDCPHQSKSQLFRKRGECRVSNLVSPWNGSVDWCRSPQERLGSQESRTLAYA